MLSTAAACEAHALRTLDVVPVSPQELTAWADANHVSLTGHGQKLPMVNARRTELGLPPFSIVLPAGQQPMVAPDPLIAGTEAELRALVRSHDGTRTGLLTSACAAWCRKYNSGNRPLNRNEVARFGAIIRQGQWLNTSEPIIFSRDALNDGQHRLTAIAETGIAVEVDVRFGVDRSAFMATNTGARRPAGQTLHIMGAKHVVPQAAVARLLFLYDHGRLGATAGRTVETADILATIAANPAIPVVAEFMVHSNFAPTRTAPFGFVLAAAARVTSLDKAIVFGAAVTGGREPDGDASRALHIRLRDMRMAGKNLNATEVALLSVLAWNAWVTGRPVHLRLSPADLAPGAFPQLLSDKGRLD